MIVSEVDRFLHWLVDHHGEFLDIDVAVRTFRDKEKLDNDWPDDWYGSDSTNTTMDGYKVKVLT